MNGYSRIIRWTLIVIVTTLASCASEPYYEAAPTSPLNVSPRDDIDMPANAQATFAWRASENAQYYEFHIYNQVSKDTTQYRRNQIQPFSVCVEGLCSLSMSVTLPNSKGHAWRVRAGNNAGLSAWSRSRFNMVSSETGVNTNVNAPTGVDTGVDADVDADALTIANTQRPPTVPGLIQPIQGVSVAAGSLINFNWSAVPGATSYDFYIYDAVNKVMVESSTDLSAESLCQSKDVCRVTRSVSLPPASSHAWRVRAVNQHGQSSFSSGRFAVVR